MNINIFESEKVSVKLTSNLLKVKKPQCCCRQYLPQSFFIDNRFDG